MRISWPHVDHMLPVLRPPHDQNVATEEDAPRSSDRHSKIDSQARVRLEEYSKPMALRPLHDDDIAIMNIRLNVVLMEVVFRDGNPLCAVIVGGKMNLARRTFSG